MSGFLGVFGALTLCDDEIAAVRRRLAPLGTERWQVVRRAGGTVALGRYDWELADEFSGPVLATEDDDTVVLADASLYYRDELRRRLNAAGAPPRSLAPAHLILAAYHAWGDALCEHVEGDFAFVVWDRDRRRILAARDLTGRRGLYYASSADTFAIASSVGALRGLPLVSDTLNLSCLGAQAAGLLWSSGADTAFRDIHVVPAAHRIVHDEHGLSAANAFWTPPYAPDRGDTDGNEAAHALRTLIGDAVQQRLAPGVTTVWMSGGWDSSAVFAAGRARLAAEDAGDRLLPVSISYPEGDPGREDELIDAIAAHWNAPVHWIDSRRIPLLEDLERRAASADEPPAHLYELWNVELARGTRALGSRTALDGAGGDQMFQVSDVLMADLLRTGRWLSLARHARTRRARGLRYLLRAGLLPLLPAAALRTAQSLLGRRVPQHYMERPAAPWVKAAFIEEHRLRERDLAVLRSAQGRSRAHAETALYLLSPVWGWGAAFIHRALLAVGVEARSPLLDRRVADFALRRPVAERAHEHETKILLRRAMAGLLPAGVLAPRQHRTGVTVGFSRARMQAAYPGLFEAAFRDDLRLADLGVVDADRLRDAADTWQMRGDFERVHLFHTLKVEFWLRGLDRRAGTAGSIEAASPDIVAAAV